MCAHGCVLRGKNNRPHALALLREAIGDFTMRHMPFRTRKIAFAALATGLLTSAGLAADSAVLTGRNALGGWTDDAPGTTRKLTVDDLEAPFVSASASNTRSMQYWTAVTAASNRPRWWILRWIRRLSCAAVRAT